ncbi:MAG: AtpZ/AtpI family protein [Acidimicrobiales bacterium]|nr:AtpZ/AtpI family protein [Acidimicrobiaceae bacterium]MXX41480.1 AtpZ/AtpI family protein [Acidimicrobiales bacterium]MYA82602.1 AtpZ/AtpI family protein [Acidimicrobiales bacterium]MYD33034.1 AtpZ/AtpI family protein [Acidimicrobiales bacterium]MYH73290.1 AtpZ/AtpI family protein [Acidimicrobiales bacterium]
MARGPAGSNGSEDGLAKAIEIALTLGIFVVAGLGLDYWLGTAPWFVLSFGTVAFIVKFIVEWYRYRERMQVHEQEMASNRPSEQRGIDRATGFDEPASLPTGVSLDADADSSA